MENEDTLPFPPPVQRRGNPNNVSRAKAARHKPARRHPIARHTPAPRTPALHELALVPAAPERVGLSLEQLTESRLAELRHEGFLWETPAPVTAHEETPAQTSRQSRQMVLASASSQQSALVQQSALAQQSALVQHSAPVPLRWRGMPVSPEFQDYALRVARGENLPPYQGQILADANLAFPWEAADVGALRKGPRRTARSLLLVAALATLAAFVLPNLTLSRPEPIAAPAPAPSQQSVPTTTVPGPLVLEPAAPSRTALPPADGPPPLASAAPKAAPQTLTPAPAPSSTLPRRAPISSVAQRPIPEPRKQVAPSAVAAPSSEPTGPSPLLIDRPSF